MLTITGARKRLTDVARLSAADARRYMNTPNSLLGGLTPRDALVKRDKALHARVGAAIKLLEQWA